MNPAERSESAIEREAPTPVAIATPPSSAPLPCIFCGYDLSQSPREGLCPECGRPANDSYPDSRPGTRWQNERTFAAWWATAWAMMFRPGWVVKHIKGPTDRPMSPCINWVAAACILTASMVVTGAILLNHTLDAVVSLSVCCGTVFLGSCVIHLVGSYVNDMSGRARCSIWGIPYLPQWHIEISSHCTMVLPIAALVTGVVLIGTSVAVRSGYVDEHWGVVLLTVLLFSIAVSAWVWALEMRFLDVVLRARSQAAARLGFPLSDGPDLEDFA